MIVSDLQTKLPQLQSLETDHKHTWCSGCGNFGISTAVKRALVLSEIDLNQVVMAYDVGCSGNESDKIEASTIHGLHGRVLPLASGIALANPKVKVIAQAGDGATYSEGINHLIHAIRNNINITFIVHNNENYGLTIGQASSTTKIGQTMTASPSGVFVPPINTLQLVLSLGPTFVARTTSWNIEQMTEIIQAGLNHSGFSYIEVLQSCPTFNRVFETKEFRQKIVDLPENYDNSNLDMAYKLSTETKSLATGIFYQNLTQQDYFSQLEKQLGKNLNPMDMEQVDISSEFVFFK